MHLVSLLSLFCLLAPSFAQQTNAKIQPHVLQVGLYPFIPDTAGDGLASLATGLQHLWNVNHPQGPAVNITFIDPNNAYTPTYLSSALTSGMYDVMEIDMILLGDVVDAGGMTPWPRTGLLNTSNDWPQSDSTPCTYENQNWGIPHWRCSYFIFNRNHAVQTATNIVELTAAIKALSPLVRGQPKFLTLTDDFDLDAVYVSAYQETYGVQPNLLPFRSIDIPTAKRLEALLDNCEINNDPTTNQCINNPFVDYTIWAALFGNRTVPTFMYYFESLANIVPAIVAPDTIYSINVNLAPLGCSGSSCPGSSSGGTGFNNNMPIYTDALVKSTRCSQTSTAANNCYSSANTFAEWYNSDAVFWYILTSQDAKSGGNSNAPFRYVMPSTQSIFNYQDIKPDYFYQKLVNLVPNANNYMTKGIDTDINNGDNLYNALIAEFASLDTPGNF